MVLILLFLWGPPVESARAADGSVSRDELSQMLAPIALYPDGLLSQVLMASTYPLQIVEAERWVRKNPLLSGDNLDDALQGKDWDASVKALCHTPTVLTLMSEHLQETSRLGDAFVDHQAEVLSVIQDLRHRAYREGNLRSNGKLKVSFRSDDTIVIEPAKSETVYVPYYNTRSIYGTWWCPDYPPWYWGPPGVVVGTGISFWPDFYVGFHLGFGYWSYFDWPGRSIIIHSHRRPRFIRHTVNWRTHEGRWRPKFHHRHGIVNHRRHDVRRFEHERRERFEHERGERFEHERGESPAYYRKTHGSPHSADRNRSPHEHRSGNASRSAAPDRSPLQPVKHGLHRNREPYHGVDRVDSPSDEHRSFGTNRFSPGREYHRGDPDFSGHHHEGWERPGRRRHR
jgi:hypothetical protein